MTRRSTHFFLALSTSSILLTLGGGLACGVEDFSDEDTEGLVDRLESDDEDEPEEHEGDDLEVGDEGVEAFEDLVEIEDLVALDESDGSLLDQAGPDELTSPGGEEARFWCPTYNWIIRNRGKYDISYPKSPSSWDNVTVRETYSKYYNDMWVWSGDTLRPHGYSSVCLNAYKPGYYSNVNLYHCVSGDPEQQWDFEPIGGEWDGHETEFLVRLIGTNWCLNANQTWNGGNLTLWSCNESDPDQRFTRLCTGYGPPP